MDEEKNTVEENNAEQNQDLTAEPAINDLTPPPVINQAEEEPEKIIVKTDSEPEAPSTAEADGSPADLPEATNHEFNEALATPPTKEEVEDAEAAVKEPIRSESDVVGTMQPEAISNAVLKDEGTKLKDSQSIDNEMATVGMASSQMGKQHHPNNKRLAIVVTIVAALLLCGIAVYVYLNTDTNTVQTAQGRENNTDTDEGEESQESSIDTSPATTEDIDALVAEIDQTINSLDDDADFNETDLSDAQLEL
jgi:hypothetical protein